MATQLREDLSNSVARFDAGSWEVRRCFHIEPPSAPGVVMGLMPQDGDQHPACGALRAVWKRSWLSWDERAGGIIRVDVIYEGARPPGRGPCVESLMEKSPCCQRPGPKPAHEAATWAMDQFAAQREIAEAMRRLDLISVHDAVRRHHDDHPRVATSSAPEPAPIKAAYRLEPKFPWRRRLIQIALIAAGFLIERHWHLF